MQLKFFNIGILGTGFMGRTHTYAYKSIPFYIQSPIALAELKVVFSRSQERANEFAKKYKFEKAFSEDWRKLIDCKEVDIVDNVLPNFLHYEPCSYALEKEKHVICEKPLAVRLSEARNLYEVSRKVKTKTMTMFNYRFIPAVQFMKEFIDSGQLGRVFQIRCLFAHSGHVNPNRPWSWKEDFQTSGGGASADLGIHVMDLLRYLVGDVSKVVALEKIYFPERKNSLGEIKKVTADDAVICVLEFKNGAFGSLEATRVGTGYKNHLRIEIHGSEGGLIWNLEDLNYIKLFTVRGFGSRVGWETILLDLPWWPPRGHIGGWQIGHVFALYRFLESIAKDEDFEPSFYDGYQAQRILEAIHVSFRERRWVDLDLIQ
ncbi:MAG: Gfo/Idh/MocA family oxidoreductase [Candidatus Aenigmarchaeota archaeon]|nr:Gfo/Idh/MocA family oxidoreductase [Candidatus Aenigmarchaeota archaeon]